MSPHDCTCPAIGKACHTKAPRRETFETKGTGKKKIFFPKTTKNPTKQTVFCHMWELQSSSIYKINGTTLWHMLQLIPRTAASKKKKSFKPNVTAGSSQNRGSPLVCLALLPLPQSENLTPNSTIEYANYLHIKNTPRKTKIHGTDTVQRYRAGFWGPRPIFFFCQLDVLVLKGARARHVVEMMLK